jgi:hypothetical protein
MEARVVTYGRREYQNNIYSRLFGTSSGITGLANLILSMVRGGTLIHVPLDAVRSLASVLSDSFLKLFEMLNQQSTSTALRDPVGRRAMALGAQGAMSLCGPGLGRP